eukprot:9535743-Heterocapsa_arctica.AAC.1
MDLAQIPDNNKERRPYRGRGKPGNILRKCPMPAVTTALFGEEHGKANAWAIRARRYRELARLRARGNHVAAEHVANAIMNKEPRNSEDLWTARDKWAASGNLA